MRNPTSTLLALLVVRGHKQGYAGSEADAKPLRRAARIDLIRAYVHVGEAAQAWALFEQIGEGPASDEHDARRTLQLLAAAYLAERKYVEAAFVKLQLLYSSQSGSH